MEGAFSFHSGFIISKTRIQFDHHHFWFLSLLLVFFIVFSICYKYKSRVISSLVSEKVSGASSYKSILLALFLVGVFSTSLTFVVRGLFYYYGPARQPWIIILSLIHFRPTQLFAYILSFSLGIYAYSRNWFANEEIPNSCIFWIPLSGVLCYLQFVVKDYLNTNLSPLLAFILILLRTFFSFSILFAFLSFGMKCWNNPSRTNRLMSENSYNIYLLHMIFVLTLQFFLMKWLGISIFFKFGIVTIASIVLSYVISQYAIRPFPRLSVLGMIVTFFLLAALLPAN
jgi:hypothetical protein